MDWGAESHSRITESCSRQTLLSLTVTLDGLKEALTVQSQLGQAGISGLSWLEEQSWEEVVQARARPPCWTRSSG